jgi:RNA polymerase sigma-70 factor (ECF subfamily)
MVQKMVRFSSSAATHDPDAQLMVKVRSGSNEAFNALVEQYEDRVRGIVTHLMGSAQQADDLTQDVFLRVYRARRSYVVGAKFSTWLFTIVRNVVSNARRTLGRRREIAWNNNQAGDLHRSEAFVVSRRESPVHDAERTETCKLVRGCIRRLASRQQTALVLCDLQGESYAGVAAALGTSEDAAKSLIHRGRSNLRRMLEADVHRGNIL